MMLLSWCLGVIFLLPVMVVKSEEPHSEAFFCNRDQPKELFPNENQPDEWHAIPVQYASLPIAGYENRYELDGYSVATIEVDTDRYEFNFELYMDTTSELFKNRKKTLCICIKDSIRDDDGANGQCLEHARICFKQRTIMGNYGQSAESTLFNYVTIASTAATGRPKGSDTRCMIKYDITINTAVNLATLNNASLGGSDNTFPITSILKIEGTNVPLFQIGLVAFFEDGGAAHPFVFPLNSEEKFCRDDDRYPERCKHHDYLFVRKAHAGLPIPAPPQEPADPLEVLPPNPPAAANPPESTSTTTDAAASASTGNLVLYIVIGIVILAFVILLIIVILRCIQGKWLCGIACFAKEQSSEENLQQTYKFTGNDEINNIGGGGSGSNDKQTEEKPNENIVEEGKQAAENEVVQKSSDAKVSVNDRKIVQAAPDGAPTVVPTPDAPKKKPSAEGKKEEKEKKGEKTSKSSSSSEAETKTKGTVSKAPQPDLAPNMLLLETKEDETQKLARSPSKRKANIEKNYKEPPQTKNITQDPGALATKGGKAVVIPLKKTDAKTGVPKSETDLATDKPEKESRRTKGVSATQGDHVTETVGPTQRATTMATGAGKTTKGVSATQGDHVTVATTQRTLATGAAKTTKGVSATQGDHVTEAVGPTQRTATMVTGHGKTSKGVSATQGDQYTENVGTTQRTQTMATGAGRTSKGVSATQGDHYTENVGTTQRTRTMATGAGKTTKGVSATQGDHITENVGTTQRTGTMATGAGKTSKGVSATQGDNYTENVGTTQPTATMVTGAGKTTKGVSATQGDKA